MTDANRTPINQWTKKQAVILAVICLTAGIAGGWGIRASQSPAITGISNASAGPAPAAMGASTASQASSSQASSPARLKEMADAQAAPLVDKLKSDPGNPDVLTSVGNIYYDAQQYPDAVDYYGRVLKAKPSDAAVRTDMATAYWYMGKADEAIAEFNKALISAPNNPNTLFNLGLVKWQGKKDAQGAIADWEKLLVSNPTYEGKEKVEQLLTEVKQHAAANR
ncbi:MAG: tetratricopeptide repeat protein [Terracidiphilus sp.]|jgi:tetratricopeptide (TPR) repeat protein